jgi:hypothetical protein
MLVGITTLRFNPKVETRNAKETLLFFASELFSVLIYSSAAYAPVRGTFHN